MAANYRKHIVGSAAIPCPACANPISKVLDTRFNAAEVFVRRRRECCKCGFRYTTHEINSADHHFGVEGRAELIAAIEQMKRVANKVRAI